MKKKKPMTVSEAGRRGGFATAKKLTKEQRSESARRASLARWKDSRKKNEDEEEHEEENN